MHLFTPACKNSGRLAADACTGHNNRSIALGNKFPINEIPFRLKTAGLKSDTLNAEFSQLSAGLARVGAHIKAPDER